ncbi:glycosyl transferase, family 9 [Psychromonas ingrahamii 37]|uniref:Glycosyl transferase, family 9 n=1 Tax=Psychromonas ingrahamii (strain DSM 17664 / CCUG 51855 / 37) TaxID=357804 RepID=A1SRT0_PSYIN|nr:glycosyltransferase family 9 protein [Psychromonas ingrahamii]ABM02195.1 glycosyl transferase, family 9 [Psychromonas ingrahamii 37]
MPLFTSAPNSICILRLSAIGDVCHAIACLQAIQRQWPSTKITWVTGKLEAQLLQHISGIEVIIFDKKQGWKAYKQLRCRLKDRKFDVLLHMQAALRASIASLMIKADIKLGFDRPRAKDGQWLFTNCKIEQGKSVHVLDGFMAFAKKLGISDLSVKWNINIPIASEEKATTLIDNKPTFIICPAASKAYKNWTIEGYSALANHAIKQGFQVLICGAPTEIEKALAKKIVASSNQQAKNLIGQTSLIDLLALIKQASIVLAPDTGPTHMATMVNTPVIGLYAHHNPKRTGPYAQLSHVVSVYDTLITEQSGKTAEELPWRARVKDENAMQKIAIKVVITMFDNLCQKQE